MYEGFKEAEATAEKNEKTETQKKNWITWAEVEKKKNELMAEVDKFKDNKELKAGEYDTLLQFVILSLFTDIPPRRNQDYLDMYIVKKHTEGMPADKNYFDVATKRFIFNKYKTSKKYGVQVENVTPALFEHLSTYLKHHALWKNSKARGTPQKFFVTRVGEPLIALNTITRILNKIFGKKVGATLLRHIYLSDKFGDTVEEMKKDSAMMAHGAGVQRAYIKIDKPVEQTGPYLEINPIELPPPAPHA
jgi:hypothetical protein